MAEFGRRGVSYTPYFAEAMGGITDAFAGRREKSLQREKNELVSNAFMGDPMAMQDLAQLDPELARQTEDQAMQRKTKQRTEDQAIDSAFQTDVDRIITQVAAFPDFASAQEWGTQQTNALKERYPDRGEGQPDFTEETFNTLKTIGTKAGAKGLKPVGSPYPVEDPATGKPGTAVAMQDAQGNVYEQLLGGASGDGGLRRLSQYDVELKGKLAEAGALGAEVGQAAGVVQTADAVAEAEATADAAAGAKVELPVVVERATTTINALNGIRNDPALDSVTGAGWLNPAKLIPGTKAHDFMQRIRQMEGKLFAQAYETLKGGGPITEIESAEAKAAIARMSTAQSKENYLSALDDFESSIRRGVANMEKQAAGDFSYQPIPERISGVQAHTRNNPARPTSAAEMQALTSGDYFIDPDGNMRTVP